VAVRHDRGFGPDVRQNVWNTAGPGTARPMLYTVFIVLAIVALLLFIFGRRRV
jgi:hypothetical protein